VSVFVWLPLGLIVLWAVAGPLVSPWIEERLEWFLLALGIAAISVTWSWSEAALIEAILRPMKVCGAVLAGSLIFSFSHDNLRGAIRRAMDRIGLRAAVALTVLLLALCACVLTSVVAVLALVEVLTALRLERKSETQVAVLGTLAIGLAGGLSSIGGPIPAIAMAKLAEAPYPTGGGYLFGLLGPWIVPAVITVAVVCGFFCAEPAADRDAPAAEDPLTLWSMLVLVGRLYVFIAGLVLLGAGLVPLIDPLLLGAHPWLLYWVNAASAVVDGATLAAVEISPRMSQDQLRCTLMGILIASGGLVTGNAPNLVAAHRLKVGTRDWAKIGLPAAAVLMFFYFLSLIVWAG